MIIQNNKVIGLHPSDVIDGVITIPEGITSIVSVEMSLTGNVIEDMKAEHYKTIVLPQSLISIEDYAFQNSVVENIVLPDAWYTEKTNELKGLVKIGDGAFCHCPKLKKIAPKSEQEDVIRIPASVVGLSKRMMEDCGAIKKVELPDHISIIPSRAFAGCKKLFAINSPMGLTNIGEEAFRGCYTLFRFDVTPYVLDIGRQAFAECYELENFVLHCIPPHIGSGALTGIPYYHVEKKTLQQPLIIKGSKFILYDLKESYVLSSTRQWEVVNLSGKSEIVKTEVDYQPLISCYITQGETEIDELTWSFEWELSNNLQQQLDYAHKFKSKKQKPGNPFHAVAYEVATKLMEEENNGKTVDTHFYNLIDQNNMSRPDRYWWSVFCYNLGIFRGGIEGQKAYEALRFYFRNLQNNVNFQFGDNLHGIPIMDNANLREMFTNTQRKKMYKGQQGIALDETKCNAERLAIEENKYHGFLREVINRFEEIDAGKTSHAGDQEKRKVTVDDFIGAIRSQLDWVPEEYREEIDSVLQYTSDKKVLELIVKIKDIQKEKNIPDHILGHPVQEQDIEVEQFVKSHQEEFGQLAGEIMASLADFTSPEYYFQFLGKHHIDNFFKVAKDADCCSHLLGAGASIGLATVLDDSTQNIVITNKDNDYVAKATIEVSKDDQYALINTFEVSKKIDMGDLSYIYEKMMLGVHYFAHLYNTYHPEQPLLCINTGTSNNDLLTFVRERVNEQQYPTILLPSTIKEEFEQLAKEARGEKYKRYDGDTKEQEMVWVHPNYADKIFETMFSKLAGRDPQEILDQSTELTSL